MNKTTAPKNYLALAALTVLFLGLSSRPGITAAGVVSKRIITDTGLSAGEVGLLTTIPVLCFGIFPILISRIINRIGYTKSIFSALTFLLIGFFIRMGGNNFTLFLGTLVMGISITTINMVLPGYIKTYYPDKAGILTTLYYSSLYIGPALAADITLRVTNHYNSWLVGINCWILIIPIALIFCLLNLAKNSARHEQVIEKVEIPTSKIFKNPLSWAISLFFAIQCTMFFTTIAWFTAILIDRGFSENEAGRLLLIFNLIAIPVALICGPIIFKTKSQYWATIASPIIFTAGFLIIYLQKNNSSYTQMLVAACLLGIGISLCGSVGFALPILRTKHSHTTLQLTTLAQTIGFTFAAIGPYLAGLIHDHTGSWNWILIGIIALGVIELFLGIVDGKARTVD